MQIVKNKNYARIFESIYYVLGILFILIAMLTYPFQLIYEKQGISSVITGFLNPVNVLRGWIFNLPFLILAILAFRWGGKCKNHTREDFVCRVAGMLFVFIPYLVFTIKTLMLIASGPGALIFFILYPLSMPVLIPVLYWIGYAITNIIYTMIYIEDIP